MYENYTRQALPEKEYRALMGSAICVFASNNAFMIENIIGTDSSYSWYDLIDMESGRLKTHIKETICAKTGNTQIYELFDNIVDMRNRIMHAYQITSRGKQVLATKTKKEKGNIQFEITEDYLMDFIKKNEKLCDMLHSYRGY